MVYLSKRRSALMINVAVVGLGEWGPNLARNVCAVSGARLYALCDVDESRLKRLAPLYPDALLVNGFDRLVTDPEVDAIVIATPASLHYEQSRRALRAGKDILVEKPLALSVREARDLVSLAEKTGRIAMVGHTFLFNAAVKKIREYVKRGELGKIYYVAAARVSLGRIREDVNAMWNLAPHDLSILLYLFGGMPVSVIACGAQYLPRRSQRSRKEDVVFLTLEFPGGLLANLHVSWLNPIKIRQMTFIGSKKMLISDDVSREAKITLYDRGVEARRKVGRSAAIGSFAEFQLKIRAGEAFVPRLDFQEPLKLEMRHFIDCIRSRSMPLTHARQGLQVVRILEAAQRSLRQGGKKITIPRAK
jgi:predicted dehydrogenase